MKLIFQFFIIIAIGVLCCRQVHAQAVTYGYDASGNRISRVITLNSKAPKAEPEDTTETTESELTGEEKVYSEMLKDFTVKIYPNPTQGKLTVEIGQLQARKTASLRLYGLQGKLILQRTGLHGGSEHLNISDQPVGIYMMTIVTQDSSTTWKIIKK